MTLFDLPPAAPEGPLVRVRLTVAYDGGGFRGFAANAGVRTVAGTLGAALERVLGHQVDLTCAGRTDAGVHAWGQVVTFDAREEPVGGPAGAALSALARSVNALCGPEVVVRDAAVAVPDFDARHSAEARCYRYTVLNRPVPDPFLARTAWWIGEPLDLRAMQLACDPLIGEHDFASFCRRPKAAAGQVPASLVRRVIDARWHDLGHGVLRFEIEANAFCHQMVRSVVGTLTAVGRGRLRAGDLAAIVRAADRQAAADLAPPHGLCLWAVRYPADRPRVDAPAVDGPAGDLEPVPEAPADQPASSTS